MMKKFLIFLLLAAFLCLCIQPLPTQEKKEDLKTQLDQTVKKKTSPAYSPRGRKDPFKDMLGKPKPAAKKRAPAKKGTPALTIANVKLIGIVQVRGQYTAIIIGSENFPMFVRTGDRFYDGYVLKIEESKVIFRKTRQGRLPLSKPRNIVKEIKF